MKITDIKRQKRRQDLFNVYVDGNFAFVLPELLVLKSRIEIGKELTDDEIKQLRTDDEAAKIMNKAFDYLSRRNHSVKELKNKLIKKFSAGYLIEKTIKRLKELGYLNDEIFAREWIESRLKNNPKGRILIRRELLAKGVEIGSVEKILDLVYNKSREKKELAKIFDLKQQKFKHSQKQKNRFVSYLLRRGFPWEDIKELLESGDYR